MLTLYLFISITIFVALVTFIVIHDVSVTFGFFGGERLSTGIFRWSVLLFTLSWLPFVNIVWIPVIIFILYNECQIARDNNDS